MTITDRITKARTGIILDAPFFGSLLLRLKMIRDNSKPTFCTDGKVIRYNEVFASKLSDDELKGVLVHEVAHPALGHLWRMGNRDPKRWNMAADFAVNQLLDDYATECRSTNKPVPWKLPDGGCLDSAMRGKSSEEIYNLLADSPPKGGTECSPGEFETPAEGCSQDASETDWKVAVTQAAQAAKVMGNCPSAIRRLVEELVNPKVPWHDVLREFLRSPAHDDYSWTRPNTRYAASGFLLPSLSNERLGRIVIAVDTSGSITQEDLKDFCAEVQGCLDETQPECIEVVYCDAAVAGVEEFQPGDVVRLDARGGGGTDFCPVFDHANQLEQLPAALVYLTDGCGRFPKNEPEYPVLWAFTERGIKAPFGQSVLIR